MDYIGHIVNQMQNMGSAHNVRKAIMHNHGSSNYLKQVIMDADKRDIVDVIKDLEVALAYHRMLFDTEMRNAK